MEFRLGPAAIAAGHRLFAFDSIGSTNAEALARARDGDPGAAWFVSSAQSAGRGRRGRAWATPPGNLAATHLVVTDWAPERAAMLGFVAGLALVDALARLAPSVRPGVAVDGAAAGRDRFVLKWPNDVLADGAKLSGILLEAEAITGGRRAIAAGIGVNVLDAPEGLPYPATSLAGLGAEVDAARLFEALSEAWVPRAAALAEGGFAAIRDAWLAHAAGLGGPAAVRVGERVVTGTFETIDESGRLIVRESSGARATVTAGDVHFGVAATVAS